MMASSNNHRGICHLFAATGQCRFSHCNFSHDIQPKNPELVTPQQQKKIIPRAPDSRTCRYFAAQEKCPFGEKCRFLHTDSISSSTSPIKRSNDEVDSPQDHHPFVLPKIAKISSSSSTNCRDFMKLGRCPYGRECRFDHPDTRHFDLTGTRITITMGAGLAIQQVFADNFHLQIHHPLELEFLRHHSGQPAETWDYQTIVHSIDSDQITHLNFRDARVMREVHDWLKKCGVCTRHARVECEDPGCVLDLELNPLKITLFPVFGTELSLIDPPENPGELQRRLETLLPPPLGPPTRVFSLPGHQSGCLIQLVSPSVASQVLISHPACFELPHTLLLPISREAMSQLQQLLGSDRSVSWDSHLKTLMQEFDLGHFSEFSSDKITSRLLSLSKTHGHDQERLPRIKFPDPKTTKKPCFVISGGDPSKRLLARRSLSDLIHPTVLRYPVGHLVHVTDQVTSLWLAKTTVDPDFDPALCRIEVKQLEGQIHVRGVKHKKVCGVIEEYFESLKQQGQLISEIMPLAPQMKRNVLRVLPQLRQQLQVVISVQIQGVLLEGLVDKVTESKSLINRAAARLQRVTGDQSSTSHQDDQSDKICPFCFDTVLDPVTLKACGHVYCRECITSFLVGSASAEQTSVIACQDPACQKPVHLSDFSILSSVQLDQAQRQMWNKYLRAHWQEWRSCPSPGCSSIFSADQRVIFCDACSMFYCTSCHFDYYHSTLSHQGLTCDQFTRQLGSTREAQKWISQHARLCPQCRTPIERNGGCNHMRCTFCRTEFCHKCLKEWNQVGGYGHKCTEIPFAPLLEETKLPIPTDTSDHTSDDHFPPHQGDPNLPPRLRDMMDR